MAGIVARSFLQLRISRVLFFSVAYTQPMLATLALALIAPANGVLAIEGLAVGQVRNGKWRTCDQGPRDPVSKASTKIAYTLETDGSIKTLNCGLKYTLEDPEGLQSWYTEPMQRTSATWFGPRPKAPAMIVAKNDIYVKVLGDYLKAKGMKGAKPRLEQVILTDLDGNGTREAVIFAMSQPEEQMWSTLSLDGKQSHPEDYACVLIRYVSGKSTKMCEVLWTDGRKGSLEGFWKNAGIWNLDGLAGSELLIGSRYYEGGGGLVYRFKNGKATKIVEHVVGV